MQSKNIKQLKEAFKGWREYTSINEQQLSTPGPDDEGGRQLDKTPKMSMSNDLAAFKQAIKDGYEILIPIPDSNLDEVKSESARVRFDGFFVRTPNGIFYLDLKNLTFKRSKISVKGVSPEKVLQYLQDLGKKGKFDLSFGPHKELMRDLTKLNNAAKDIVLAVDKVEIEKLADADIRRELLKATSFFKDLTEKFDYIRAWYFGDEAAARRLVAKFRGKYQPPPGTGKGKIYKTKVSGTFDSKIEKVPTKYTKYEVNREELKDALQDEKTKLEIKKEKGLGATKNYEVYSTREKIVQDKIDTIDELLDALNKLPPPKPGAGVFGRGGGRGIGKQLLRSFISGAQKIASFTLKNPKTAGIGAIAAAAAYLGSGIDIKDIVDDLKPTLGHLPDPILIALATKLSADPTGMSADYIFNVLDLLASEIRYKRQSFVLENHKADDNGPFYTRNPVAAREYDNFQLIDKDKDSSLKLRRVQIKDLPKLERIVARSLDEYGTFNPPDTFDSGKDLPSTDASVKSNVMDFLQESNNKKLKITLGNINESKLVSTNKVLKITIS